MIILNLVSFKHEACVCFVNVCLYGFVKHVTGEFNERLLCYVTILRYIEQSIGDIHGPI